MNWPDALMADVVEQLLGHPMLAQLIEQRVEEVVAQRNRREWYTTAEAAQRLGISDAAVRMRVTRGRLRARVDQGRRLHILAADVDAAAPSAYCEIADA